MLTARQYGEVVLPDAASGHDPDTLASFARHSDFSREGVKAVTVQGGYGVVFANPGTSFIGAGRVAVQV